MPKRDLTSRAVYARHRGVSVQAVNAHTIDHGGPIPTYGRQKRVDPVEADQLWPRRGSVDASRLLRARTAVLGTRAQGERLAFARKRGRVIDRTRAEAAALNWARQLRDAWLGWPARVGAELAHALSVDPTVLVVMLETYVHRHLEELATMIVARTWPTPHGLAVPLARVAIDAGFATTQVHAWARTQPSGRVMLVKGGPQGPALVSLPRAAEAIDTASRVRRRRRGLRVWQVNVHAFKAELYGALRLDGPAPGTPTPPGWVSFPAVGDEFLRQLTAEALVRKVVRGVERLEWVKVYNRNETLDTAIYSRAAAHVVGVDRFTEADWRTLETPFEIPPSP
jgi:hypothetical protein